MDKKRNYTTKADVYNTKMGTWVKINSYGYKNLSLKVKDTKKPIANTIFYKGKIRKLFVDKLGKKSAQISLSN